MKSYWSTQLGPMPLALAYPDGGLMKTQKAKLLHYLEENTPSSVSRSVSPNSVWILDAMAILHSISLREIPKTFGKLAILYLKKVEKIARESSANTVHLVTDQYPTVSIKNAERDWRAKIQSASQLTLTLPSTSIDVP